MALKAEQIDLVGVTVDPTTPPDGATWYRSDLNETRKRVNGVTVTIEDKKNATNTAFAMAIIFG